MYLRQRLLPLFTRAQQLGIDLYKESNIRPDVVADFAGERSASEYYRLGNTEVSFDDMFSYTGASNKTMTDSDGNLKWAPHNLVPDSTTITNALWSESSITYIEDSASGPFGGTTTKIYPTSTGNRRVIIQPNCLSSSADRTETYKIWVKADGWSDWVVLGHGGSVFGATDVCYFDAGNNFATGSTLGTG